MPAAVKVVELRFGHRIIDIDRGNEEPVFLMHFVKSMHPGGCFLGNTAPFLDDLMPAKRIFALNLEEQILYDLLFPVGRFSFRLITAFLGAYFSRIAIRPGISFSAMPISFLPKSARLISATL